MVNERWPGAIKGESGLNKNAKTALPDPWPQLIVPKTLASVVL